MTSLANQQACAPQHTPAPAGYLAWHEWAEKKTETHEPQRCPNCGLWAIWTPKDEPQGGDDHD
jgi:hypothetical protein